MPARDPGEPAVAGDVAGLGHAGQPEVGGVGQHGGEHHTRVVGRQPRVEVGEVGAEPGPVVDLGEQVGDAQAGQHAVETAGESLGRLRGDGVERCDLQLCAADPDLGQRVAFGLVGDLRQPAAEPVSAVLQVSRGRCGCSDGQLAVPAHALKDGRRHELVLDGAPLPAALDPDVARPQPVAQREQGRHLPGSPVRTGGRQHDIAPGRLEKPDRQAVRPVLAAAAVDGGEDLGRAQRADRGRHGAEAERP